MLVTFQPPKPRTMTSVIYVTHSLAFCYSNRRWTKAPHLTLASLRADWWTRILLQFLFMDMRQRLSGIPTWQGNVKMDRICCHFQTRPATVQFVPAGQQSCCHTSHF